MRRLYSGVAAVILAAVTLGPAAADSVAPKRDWPHEKCFRYGRDWNEALRRFGREGLSDGFVASNAAFLRAGCVAVERVCPETERDRKVADALAIRVVNEGMSTTFLPFGCP